VLLTATEYNTSSAFDIPVTLFKQGTRCTEAIVNTVDEEKSGKSAITTRSAGGTADNVAPEKPANKDEFTWQHIQYVVPVSDSERRLLDDVSGYVAPGRLTALMGESGAGKARCILVLRSLR